MDKPEEQKKMVARRVYVRVFKIIEKIIYGFMGVVALIAPSSGGFTIVDPDSPTYDAVSTVSPLDTAMRVVLRLSFLAGIVIGPGWLSVAVLQRSGVLKSSLPEVRVRSGIYRLVFIWIVYLIITTKQSYG